MNIVSLVMLLSIVVSRCIFDGQRW